MTATSPLYGATYMAYHHVQRHEGSPLRLSQGMFPEVGSHAGVAERIALAAGTQRRRRKARTDNQDVEVHKVDHEVHRRTGPHCERREHGSLWPTVVRG